MAGARTWPDMPPLVQGLLKREGTGISWTDLTFNPWIGCTKVGPPCFNCYADTMMGGKGETPVAGEGRRLRRVAWGPGQERQRTSKDYWKRPLRWQRVAAAAGVTLDVFCASLADWADNEVDDRWRLDLADVILKTPNLRWMLLTKRIPLVERYLRAMFPQGVPPNVALGITVAEQPEVKRDLPRAVAVKSRLGIRYLFLSMEPLLGPVILPPELLANIDLVIVGGESGRNPRPMHPAWALALMQQCLAAGVAFHFKQWGEWLPVLKMIHNDDPPGTWRRVGTATVFGRTYEGDSIHHFPDGQPVVRVGTTKAGRMIGGREYLERLAA